MYRSMITPWTLALSRLARSSASAVGVAAMIWSSWGLGCRSVLLGSGVVVGEHGM
jgi:hypothetical protein